MQTGCTGPTLVCKHHKTIEGSHMHPKGLCVILGGVICRWWTGLRVMAVNSCGGDSMDVLCWQLAAHVSIAHGAAAYMHSCLQRKVLGTCFKAAWNVGVLQ